MYSDLMCKMGVPSRSGLTVLVASPLQDSSHRASLLHNGSIRDGLGQGAISPEQGLQPAPTNTAAAAASSAYAREKVTLFLSAHSIYRLCLCRSYFCQIRLIQLCCSCPCGQGCYFKVGKNQKLAFSQLNESLKRACGSEKAIVVETLRRVCFDVPVLQLQLMLSVLERAHGAKERFLGINYLEIVTQTAQPLPSPQTYQTDHVKAKCRMRAKF